MCMKPKYAPFRILAILLQMQIFNSENWRAVSNKIMRGTVHCVFKMSPVNKSVICTRLLPHEFSSHLTLQIHFPLWYIIFFNFFLEQFVEVKHYLCFNMKIFIDRKLGMHFFYTCVSRESFKNSHLLKQNLIEMFSSHLLICVIPMFFWTKRFQSTEID